MEDIHISDLKIGDVAFYQATEDDIKNIHERINNVGFGFISGGLDEPNFSYGITSLGSYLEQVYVMMNSSKNDKLKIKITCLNPLKVEPLLIYQRGIQDGDMFYFPRFAIGRLYDNSGKIIEYN